MKKLSGSISSGKGGVKQMRGPGMNAGLKKPRQGKFYNGEADRAAPAKGKSSGKGSSKSSSYLPDFMVSGGGNVPKGGGRKK